MMREDNEQLLLNRLSTRVRLPLAQLSELFAKDALYRNAPLIYRMNRKLEFPLQLLAEQVRSITSREDLLLKALASHQIAGFVAATKRVRLRYRGSERIVVVTGIRKEYVEAMVVEFRRNSRKVKINCRGGKYELECESEETAGLLKRHIREKKKWFDLQEDSQYKAVLHQKIRIVIEGEELYTLLVDNLFGEERKDFLVRLDEKPGVYEPIVLQPKDFVAEQQPFDDDELYSEDRTSTNMSETQESRFYKELIETQEVSTQLTMVDQDTLRDLQETEHRQVVQVYEPQTEDTLVEKEINADSSHRRRSTVTQSPLDQPKAPEIIASQPVSQPELQKEAEPQASEQEGGQEIVLEKLTIEAADLPPEQDEALYSFEFIDDMFTHLTKNKLLSRPDVLNHRKVEVAADDHGHKLFFDKLCERRRQNRPKRQQLQSP